MLNRLWRRLGHAVRWFFGAPFHAMSDAFGDPVQPEVHVFEARVAEMQHLDRGSADRVQVDHPHTKALKG